MPRVETFKHRYTDENGDSQVTSIAYDVSRDGIFMASLPLWLVENVGALLETKKWQNVTMTHLLKNVRVACPTLSPLKGLIDAALQEFSAPEVKSELVIRYAITTEAAAWELPDGRLAPNGVVGEHLWRESHGDPAASPHADQKSEGYGGWVEELRNLNATNSAHGGYMVRVGAVVEKKTTTTRGKAVNVEYAVVRDASASDQPAIWRLNSFVCLSMSNESRFFSGNPVALKEMPYSPEAADFFYSMLLGVAQLALRMERFFADQTVLLEHIQKGTLLLGPSEAAPTEGE